jgi:hypothetical protein
LPGSSLRGVDTPSKAPKAFVDLDETFPDGFASEVGRRLNQASLEQLLSMPELDYIVDRWGIWGDATRIPSVFQPMVDDDRQLVILLDKFVRTGLRQSGNRMDETYQLSMKTLSTVMDLDATEQRVRSLQFLDGLSVRQRAAVSRYLKGLQRIKEGKDPDGFYLEDVS